jgi:hypothetical protein
MKAGAVVDRADDVLYNAAWDVADLAKAYVPIDEYNLQDAITVEPTSEGYKVFVDLSHEGTRAPTVEQYAKRMENGIGWSGIARAGPPRGARFMARAAAEVENDLGGKVAAAARAPVGFIERISGFVGRARSGVGGFIKRLFG